MSDEPKRCPFCGSAAVTNTVRDNRYNCSKMGCYMSQEWRPYGLSLNDWESRPIEDALREELAQAQAKIDGLQVDEITKIGDNLSLMSAMLRADKAEKENATLREALTAIGDIAYDRDGMRNAEDLGDLVDELRDIARAALEEE